MKGLNAVRVILASIWLAAEMSPCRITSSVIGSMLAWSAGLLVVLNSMWRLCVPGRVRSIAGDAVPPCRGPGALHDEIVQTADSFDLDRQLLATLEKNSARTSVARG